MKTLDELAILFGTDKGTKHPHAGHGYAPHYDRLFSSRRNDALKLLEIGVGGGESIRMWLEYFPRASVHGIDMVKDTNPYNTPGSKEIARYTFRCGNQMDTDFWKAYAQDFGMFDIIIDDGGHRNDEIITTFCSMWGALNPGGLYCIEDLGVCYGVGSIFVNPGLPAHNEFLKTKLDEVLKDTHGIDWMCLSKELAVIRKRE